MQPANLSEVLRGLTDRYGSVDDIVRALQGHPGFKTLNRATVYRWRENPSPRAALAIEILSSKFDIGHAGSLRIAEPETLWVLPSTVLAWEAQKGRPYGLLKQRYGIQATVKPVPTGGDAFTLLSKGEVEIATGARDLLASFSPNCQRLCALTRSHVAGICRRSIQTIFDLDKLSFGFPSRSGIAARLNHLSRDRGITFGRLVPIETPAECAKALSQGKSRLDGFIAWDSFIDKIRAKLPASLTLHPIPQGFLGSIEMSIAINPSIAKPGLVRAYLWAVRQAAAYVNERKDRPSFQREISKRTHLEYRDVQQTLQHSAFGIDDLDPEIVLGLWEREADQARSAAQRP